MKPTTIKTDRLILRRAIYEDSEDLFKSYLSDSDSSRFLTRKAFTNIDQANKMLTNWCDKPWDNDLDKFAWVISLSETYKAIGIFLVELEGVDTVQIHYGISKAFARQGLITEAGHAVIEWLKMQENIRRIFAICDQSNLPSKRVLEKIGFQCEGIFDKKLKLPAFDNVERDFYLYAYNILK